MGDGTVKTLVTLVAFTFVGSPIVAVAITIARASQTSIDRAVLLAGLGIFAIGLGVAIAIVINAAANYRAAALPRPSHQIDNRRQSVTLNSGAPANMLEEVLQ